MAIDSVGGGSRDPNEPLRAKHQQEERAREMAAAETRRKEELGRLLESRENEIQSLAETQARDIANVNQTSRERLEQAKGIAQSRVREFEHDSQRLTEEAKRQFQTKAAQLQKSAGELEGQRTQLIKSHQASMTQIKENNDTALMNVTQRNNLESAKQHINQTRRIEDITERGNFEAQRISDDMQDRKHRTESEGHRTIARLEDKLGEQTNQIQSEADFARRAGNEQLNRERENLSKQHQRAALDADDRMSRLNFEAERVLNRTHAEGTRKIAQTQSLANQQISDTERDARRKLHDVNTRSAFNMQSITLEAEGQEQIARRAYAQQKELLTGARDKSITDSTKLNEEMQKRLAGEYDLRKHTYEKTKENALLTQLANDERELKFHRDAGKQQINAAIAKNAVKVATHDTKAADPFYRTHQIAAQVADNELQTMISLAIPEHEQDTVRLTLQRGNRLTLSGTRRFEDKVKGEAGREFASNSYQSYSESFPVAGKLEMKNMTRNYENGRLTFRIPKG